MDFVPDIALSTCHMLLLHFKIQRLSLEAIIDLPQFTEKVSQLWIVADSQANLPACNSQECGFKNLVSMPISALS